MLPGIGISFPKLAFIDTKESVLMIPKQFGPTREILYFLQISTVSFSSSIPLPPISLKPAEIIIADLTPFWPHSFMTEGVTSFGTMRTAKSMGSGMALIFG